LDDSPKSFHIVTRDNTCISCFCKYACTLFWGAQTSGRNCGAVLGAVLICALSMPASATASSAKGRASKARASSCAYANLRPSAAERSRVDAATLCLIDRVRAAHHLRPLRANSELQSVATTLVGGMVRRNYYNDNSPSGQSPGSLIATIPYGAHAASLSTAQDLGWGTLSDATPAGMVRAWMSSPPHREIILTAAFRDAGVGVAPAVPEVIGRGTHGATYAVEFAARS
jgi:uncharacterized protein YkwD